VNLLSSQVVFQGTWLFSKRAVIKSRKEQLCSERWESFKVHLCDHYCAFKCRRQCLKPKLNCVYINTQGHPMDCFDKLSVPKAFNSLWFLKRIVTLNFCEMRNLISVFFFELLKMSFGVPKKVGYHFWKGNKTYGFQEVDNKALINSRIFKFP